MLNHLCAFCAQFEVTYESFSTISSNWTRVQRSKVATFRVAHEYDMQLIFIIGLMCRIINFRLLTSSRKFMQCYGINTSHRATGSISMVISISFLILSTFIHSTINILPLFTPSCNFKLLYASCIILIHFRWILQLCDEHNLTMKTFQMHSQLMLLAYVYHEN